MNIIRAILGSDPKPGEVYINDDGDPFHIHTAEVLEVKNGWVMFSWIYRGSRSEHSDTFFNFKLFWKIKAQD